MKKKRRCVLCGYLFKQGEWGNNPAPLSTIGYCCNECNIKKVIPARLNSGTIRTSEESKTEVQA